MWINFISVVFGFASEKNKILFREAGATVFSQMSDLVQMHGIE